jgi:hypothetical protein
LSINVRSVIGGSFGGSRYLNSGTLRYRQGDNFNIDLTYQNNRFQLPGGDFFANILRTQLSYAFTPSIYLQGLVQNNTVNKLWAVNVRFSWLQRANTGLFVVYNHNFQEGDPLNNSLIIKYTRMFDLVK